MVYSPEQLDEIEGDPVRLREYFKHVMHNAVRIANRYREQATRPTTEFDEGMDLMKKAEHMESFSEALLKHMDAFVESSMKDFNKAKESKP